MTRHAEDTRTRLEAFVGEWTVDARFPDGSPMGDIPGRSTFEWTLDGAFLLQRSEVDHPDAPNGLILVGVDAESGGYTQHYFDSRGVARVYAMTFDGTTWTLERTAPDFTPLDFSQRFTATFEDAGRTIRGAWEICHDSTSWEKDFDLVYTREAALP